MHFYVLLMFSIRILALKENFLLKFEMEVSVSLFFS